VSKDRAAPFSRKHRRYWLPVTGGMILIGALNLAIGYCAYEPPPPPPQKIELVLPPSSYAVRAGAGVAGADAGIDAAAEAGIEAAPPPPVAVPPSATTPR
jgi:hypothetical protein